MQRARIEDFTEPCNFTTAHFDDSDELEIDAVWRTVYLAAGADDFSFIGSFEVTTITVFNRDPHLGVNILRRIRDNAQF